jgi:hypothetical protein
MKNPDYKLYLLYILIKNWFWLRYVLVILAFVIAIKLIFC